MSLLYFFKWSRVFNFALITLLFCQIYPAFAFDPESLLEEKDLSSGTTPHLYTDIFVGMPEDILLVTFSYFSTPELCKLTEVCKGWNKVANNERLWKLHKNRIYGSFPDDEVSIMSMPYEKMPNTVRKSLRIKENKIDATSKKKQRIDIYKQFEFQQTSSTIKANIQPKTSKEKVITFLLRVRAQAESDPDQVETLIQKYMLNEGYKNPYTCLLVDIFDNFDGLLTSSTSNSQVEKHDLIEILQAQRHALAVQMKRSGFNYGSFGFSLNKTLAASYLKKIKNMPLLEGKVGLLVPKYLKKETYLPYLGEKICILIKLSIIIMNYQL